MAGYLICVNKESGVPIFARKLGELEHIDFPVAAALHSIRAFGQAYDIDLTSTRTDNSRFIWKDYAGGISLIFGGTDDTLSELHVVRMLENIYYAMALHVGMHNLTRPGSVDKLRRQLKFAYPTIDKILHGFRPTELTMYFSDLTACIDVQFQSTNSASKSLILLEAMVQNLGVLHAVLYSVCTVLASTAQWAEISTADRILIGLATQGISFPEDQNTVETTVYLPRSRSDPDVPLRLVVILCSDNLRLSLLCGVQPPIKLIRREASKVLASLAHVVAQLDLKSLSPPRKLFDAHLYTQGFLFRNIHDRTCGFAMYPDSAAPSPSTCPDNKNRTVQKLECLRIFFRNMVPDCFPWIVNGRVTSTLNRPQKAKESYWTSEYYKCHAVQYGPYQLFVMYDASITQVPMRAATWRLFRSAVRDRAIK